MPFRTLARLLTGTAVISVACLSSVAFAQDTAPSGNDAAAATTAEPGLGEIIVTASKRSENLQKAPAAVSVVNADLLQNAGIIDVSQLPKLVPSLVIGRQGGNSVVFLRGVGQTNSTPAAQPGISTNIDGIYLPRELGAGSLFDLERIEVLPGPQGTLYGRNSAGGAINLVTRKPGTEYAAEGWFEAGNYSLFHGFAAVDIPVSTSFAVRAAVDINNRDGYLSNGGNDEDSISARISALFRPSDNFSALVQYSYLRQDGVGMQFMARGTDNPPFGSATDPWFNSFPKDRLFNHNRGHVVNGTFTFALNDDITMTYLPSYMQAKVPSGLQFNGDSYVEFYQSVKQYSQELRFSGNGNDRLKWLFGLFWYKSHSTIDVKLGAPVGPPIAFVNFDNRLNSYAAFGQATYSLTDALRITVGGRYSSDKFDGSGFQKVPIFGISHVFGAKQRKGHADWKIGMEYDVAPRSMLYLTAQSGYLQGGFTQADLDSDLPKTFKPVKLFALTGGTKNRFLDNRLQINNEIFFYSYSDYQTQTVQVDPATQLTAFLVFNVPKTEIYGDQLDIAYSAGANTDLNLSVAYLHTKVTKGFATAPTFKGFRMPNAPTWTINGSIEHRFPLANGAHIAARVASSYNSGYWTVFAQSPFSNQKAFTKTDANLTYHSADDRWYFGAWARNLENNAVYYGADTPSAPGAFVPTFIDAPRTYGLRAGFNF